MHNFIQLLRSRSKAKQANMASGDDKFDGMFMTMCSQSEDGLHGVIFRIDIDPFDMLPTLDLLSPIHIPQP